MARTAEGRQLSAQHRQAQLQIRARVLRDFQRIWPLWQGDERSFREMVRAALLLVQTGHQWSSALAVNFYERFREAEAPGGSPTPRTAEDVDLSAVESSLYVTGAVMTRNAVAAGFSPQAARQNALVRVSGAMTRHVLLGGRDALLRSTASDKRAQGWARTASGSACAFCAMLASRGAVYSERGVDFQAHDHCSCSAEVQYRDSQLPPEAQRYREQWNRAQREAEEAGELRRGTENDRLNAFRRLLDHSE